jgi:RHS repeat-associated protein
VPGGSPAATASFLYDGEGACVAQQTTVNGTTTTTRYLLGGLEELTTSGGTSTLTKYFSVSGVVSAVKVGTTLSYLVGDGLGSVSVALSSSGSATGQTLYYPYGEVRYSSGSMPTARGYTGQYQDATSGLDYYGARYYDPTLSQFTSADTVLDGLNRYAYVGGNPTTATDPTGHALWEGEHGGGGYGPIVYTPAQTKEAGGGGGGGGGVIEALFAGLMAAASATAAAAWAVVNSFGPQPATALPAWYGHSDTLSDRDAIQAARHSLTHVATPWEGLDQDYIREQIYEHRHQQHTTPHHPHQPHQPGPQPQPGGCGSFGEGPPTPGAGGTCGCDDGNGGEGPEKWIKLYHASTSQGAWDILEHEVRPVGQWEGSFVTTTDPYAAQGIASSRATEFGGGKGAIISIMLPSSLIDELAAEGEGTLEISTWLNGAADQYIFKPPSFARLNRYGWTLESTNDTALQSWYNQQIGC